MLKDEKLATSLREELKNSVGREHDTIKLFEMANKVIDNSSHKDDMKNASKKLLTSVEDYNGKVSEIEKELENGKKNLIKAWGGAITGDENTTLVTKEAKLVDRLEGVTYQIGSKSGTTDSKGKFLYDANDTTITFKVDGLIIAKDFNLSNINSDGIVLPVDIVNDKKTGTPLDRGNTSDPKVIKILRVLQSLDNDNDLSNGIFIDDNTKGLLTSGNIITDDITTLKTIVEGAKKTLKSQREARNNYKTGLKDSGIKFGLRPFVTVWETTSTDEKITIPTNTKEYTYNYTIDWGDGTIDNNVTGNKTHNYATDGNHTVKINGTFPHIYFYGGGDRKKIKMITQWGDIAWKNFIYSFNGCQYIDIKATDTPDLSNVTSLKYMFAGAYKLEGNEYFNEWDTSNVTDMEALFDYTYKFNAPVGDWDVSNVTNMRYMFVYAYAFKNHDLSMWKVKKVVNHHNFFYGVKNHGNIEPKWNK
jgi:surface protein